MLKWTGGADPSAEAPTYNIYMDSNENPTTKLNLLPLSSAQFSVTGLAKNTPYYWKVEAKNGEGTVTSDVWHFTTIPFTGTIKVTTDNDSATFEVSNGANTYYGSGKSWIKTEALLGTYTITYGGVPAYLIPDPDTQTLSADGQTITFTASYIPNESAPPNNFSMNAPVVHNDLKTVSFSWNTTTDPTPSSGMRGYKLFIEKNGATIEVYPAGLKQTTTETSVTINDILDGDGYKAYVVAYDMAWNAKCSLNKENFGPINFNSPILSVKTKDINGKNVTIASDRLLQTSANPQFEIIAIDGNGIQTVMISIEGNGVSRTQAFEGKGLIATDYSYPTDTLPEGTYNVTISSTDGTLSKTLNITLIVATGVKLLGKPISYPNPFDPRSNIFDEKYAVKIKYTMASPADVKIIIYNLIGKPVRTFNCEAGVDQGGLGGENNVPWDGKDNFNNIVANGPYFYFILVDGKIIGKGDMAVFK
jgi:hypothetical protein